MIIPPPPPLNQSHIDLLKLIAAEKDQCIEMKKLSRQVGVPWQELYGPLKELRYHLLLRVDCPNGWEFFYGLTPQGRRYVESVS